MSDGSSSGSPSTTAGNVVRCNCGIDAPLKTALTEANAGRRFFGCGNYERERGSCGFFKWRDAVTPDHVRTLLFTTLQEKEEYRQRYYKSLSEKGDLLCQLTNVEGELQLAGKKLLDASEAKGLLEEELRTQQVNSGRWKRMNFLFWVCGAFIILYAKYVKV